MDVSDMEKSFVSSVNALLDEQMEILNKYKNEYSNFAFHVAFYEKGKTSTSCLANDFSNWLRSFQRVSLSVQKVTDEPTVSLDSTLNAQLAEYFKSEEHW